MICVQNQGGLPEENSEPGNSRELRPGKSGTFDATLGQAAAATSPEDSQGNASGESQPRSRRKRTAAERERKLLKRIRRLRRLERSLMDKLDHRAKSGTFPDEVRQSPAGKPQPTAETAQPELYEHEPAERELTPTELPEKQWQAIVALVSGKSNIAVAKELGVNRRTIYRWRQLPQFQAELHGLQSQFAGSMNSKFASLADESVAVIQEALNRGCIKSALELLKGTNVLGGDPISQIDGLDAETKPNSAVVFPLPAAAETCTVQPSSSPAAPMSPAFIDTVNTQTPQAGPTLADLLSSQQEAIFRIIAGQSLAEVVAAAGVSPRTLHTWMRKDEAFRHVLRVCRTEEQQRIKTKLLNMSHGATQLLEFALKKQRNVRVAFAILRGLGLLSRLGS